MHPCPCDGSLASCTQQKNIRIHIMKKERFFKQSSWQGLSVFTDRYCHPGASLCSLSVTLAFLSLGGRGRLLTHNELTRSRERGPLHFNSICCPKASMHISSWPVGGHFWGWHSAPFRKRKQKKSIPQKSYFSHSLASFTGLLANKQKAFTTHNNWIVLKRESKHDFIIASMADWCDVSKNCSVKCEDIRLEE